MVVEEMAPLVEYELRVPTSQRLVTGDPHGTDTVQVLLAPCQLRSIERSGRIYLCIYCFPDPTKRTKLHLATQEPRSEYTG
jgi:hypothetical protein